jgi:Aerotolerance regulator N-terminal/von Willebrand factor type A domain
MSFLAPLFLLGALTVALPVIFHLVRRSSQEQMPFSSLMFLQAAPPRVTKRTRLEHLLLLLLRCLVICLLALGFARPFFRRPMTASPRTANVRKILVLIDTSASMRRAGLWPAALAKTGEILRTTAPGDRLAVYTFDRQARPLVNFDQWSSMKAADRAELISKRLAALHPGWAATHLGNALITAAEAFAEADKRGQAPGPHRIVLISDLQIGSRVDGLQGYDWPRDVDVQVEPVHPLRPTNAGLQWVTDLDDTAKPSGIRLRVSNSADARHEQFKLRWAGVAGALPIDVYVPPGQSRVVPAPNLPAGAAGDRLVLSGDDDGFDNTVHVIKPAPEHISVRFVGDESANDPDEPLYYLRRAFQSTPRRIVQVQAQPAAARLTAGDLRQTPLLIATDPLPTSQAAALRDFARGGGTVLFVMRATNAAPTVARLAGVDRLDATEVTAPNYAMLGTIDFQNPLFAPFADPRYNDFTKIHFWKYRRLDLTRAPAARVLARFDDGAAALVEVPEGKGRLLVLTSGWQPADSQLALSSKFVPLLYSLLDLAGAIHRPLSQFHVGDAVDLAGVAAAAGGQPLTVLKPDGSTVGLSAGETRFAATDTPGLYSVASLTPPVPFAVNLDPAESRTAPLPMDQLQRLGVPLKPQEIRPMQRLAQLRRLHDDEMESREKIWRWLTLAALVLLVGETLLAGWVTRRPAVDREVAT